MADFPILVYFEKQVPNVFEGSSVISRLNLSTTIYLTHNFFLIGDLSVEEEVLQWLITQKTEDRIELITRVMLETSVEETQYLAVYFSTLNYWNS